MSPESCHLTEEEILLPSSEHWQNSGMGFHTGFLTLNTSEHNDFQEQSHKDEGVSSLSDVLETGKVAQKYYLTKKQCQGILLRAEKKGANIPESLRKCIESFIES